MPHTTPYIRGNIRDEAFEFLGGEDRFLSSIADLVADVFNERLGEQLVGGETSRVYSPIITGSQPCDVALVVVAWWSLDRAPHFRDVRRQIESDFRAMLGHKFTVEAHLNPLGAPSVNTRNVTDT